MKFQSDPREIREQNQKTFSHVWRVSQWEFFHPVFFWTVQFFSAKLVQSLLKLNHRLGRFRTMKSLTGIAVNKHTEQDNRGLRQLRARSVYLFGDAAAIENLGLFLLDCAKEMRGAKSFHRHFRDFQRGWHPEFLDVIVERSVSKAKHRPNTALEPTPTAP